MERGLQRPCGAYPRVVARLVVSSDKSDKSDGSDFGWSYGGKALPRHIPRSIALMLDARSKACDEVAVKICEVMGWIY